MARRSSLKLGDRMVDGAGLIGCTGRMNFSSSRPTGSKEGFTVVQIVAGLYPDMPPFDPRAGAETTPASLGKDYKRIRPEYFTTRPIRNCSTSSAKAFRPAWWAAWGYFMPWMGVDRMKSSLAISDRPLCMSDVLVCRRQAVPYYLVKRISVRRSRAGPCKWTEVLRYIRAH